MAVVPPTGGNTLRAALRDKRWFYSRLAAELRRQATRDGVTVPKHESLVTRQHPQLRDSFAVTIDTADRRGHIALSGTQPAHRAARSHEPGDHRAGHRRRPAPHHQGANPADRADHHRQRLTPANAARFGPAAAARAGEPPPQRAPGPHTSHPERRS
jgi:hypothetical protein